MKHIVKHIPSFYLFALLAGVLSFIPAVFSRFTTAPALWMQAGISVGIIGYVLMSKGQIPVPKMDFILLIAIWAIYLIWQGPGNIENTITVIALIKLLPVHSTEISVRLPAIACRPVLHE